MERQPSEIIEDFLELVDRSHSEYEEAKSKVSFYDSRTFTWTHDLEDAPNKAERNKLATAWQRELKERRKEKDRMKLWEKIHEMGSDATNKAYLKRLRYLVDIQKKTEEYVNTTCEEREFRKAVRDNDCVGR